MLNRPIFFITAWVAVLALSPLTHAAQIGGLYNTGVDDNGSPLALGSAEQHYQLTGPTSSNYAIVPHEAWITSPLANWIGPVNGNQTAPGGWYDYALSFDLTGFNLSTVQITGSWTSDNASEILLNGNATGFNNANQTGEHERFNIFSLTSGFIPGSNTLTFHVGNGTLGNPNPTGLIVIDLEGSAALIPEPTCAVLLLSAMVVVLAGQSTRSEVRDGKF